MSHNDKIIADLLDREDRALELLERLATTGLKLHGIVAEQQKDIQRLEAICKAQQVQLDTLIGQVQMLDNRTFMMKKIGG